MAMNKIQDKLYLGNIKAASDLKAIKANVSFFGKFYKFNFKF